MEQWYAVKTHARREAQATVVLARRGVETFFPQVPTCKRPGQRGAAVEPLFPGYLFARLEPGSNEWVAARSAPGVAYFLGPAGAPTALPSHLVDDIRARTEASLRAGWRMPYKAGDRVVINGGPMVGVEAIFDSELSAAGRVRVLLTLVDKLVRVDMHVGLLRAAGRSKA